MLGQPRPSLTPSLETAHVLINNAFISNPTIHQVDNQPHS